MSNNLNNNSQKNDSIQERSRKLTVPTQLTSNQQQLQTEQQQQTQPIQRQLPHSLSGQQQPKQKKENKKKSRGDRKRQRYRAKLRKRGLNNETIETLINNYNNSNQARDDEEHSTLPDADVALLVPTGTQVGSIHRIEISNSITYFISN